MSWLSFKLPDEFIEPYVSTPVPWGHGKLSEITYYRTYSRVKPDGTKERWHDTLRRVVEGTYTLQKNHVLIHKLPWDEQKAQRSAQKMFDYMFNMKFLPAGRGLWMMGTEYAHTRSSMALFNCAFVSLDDISPLDENPAKPFGFLMDVSMLGVGCGFDTYPTKPFPLSEPERGEGVNVADTKEGWVNLITRIINSYIDPSRFTYPVCINYSFIRQKGTPIKGFGGKAGGPETLQELVKDVTEICNSYVGKDIDSRWITDLMNVIGKCVVAGNVRRSAELAIGSLDDKQFMNLKNYTKHPERADYGRYSNNSLGVYVGDDYSDAVELTKYNGEPAYIWMDHIKHYGRMKDGLQWGIDSKAKGCNPCVEQTLESYEVCNLVEVFPTRITGGYSEMHEVIKMAYLYGKSVTLAVTHLDDTNAIILRNRRIGVSMSGIAQYIESNGVEALVQMCDTMYTDIKQLDILYSNWLAIPRSIKMTSVKPSGTVSLLAGVTSGVHYPIAQSWFKNMRMDATDPLVSWARQAGLKVEPEIKYNKDMTTYESEDTVVVKFPVYFHGIERGRADVSIWEQMNIVRLLQYYWADNQVSSTVTFKDSEREDIKRVLDFYQFDIKNVSFLELFTGAFPQMPEEETDMVGLTNYLTKINMDLPLEPFIDSIGEAKGESGCSNDQCELKLER